MKRIISVFLAIFLILAISACSARKGIKITLVSDANEEGTEFTADFFYPDDAGIEVSGDEFYSNWKILTSELENFQLSLSLFEDSTFAENREYAKGEEDTYSEFKVGQYDAYGYEAFGGYYIYIHLEKLSETSDRYVVIEANRADFSEDGPKGVAAYEENKTAKSIVNSLEYNGNNDDR